MADGGLQNLTPEELALVRQLRSGDDPRGRGITRGQVAGGAAAAAGLAGLALSNRSKRASAPLTTGDAGAAVNRAYETAQGNVGKYKADPMAGIEGSGKRKYLGLFGERQLSDADVDAAAQRYDLAEADLREADAAQRAVTAERDAAAREAQRRGDADSVTKRLKETRQTTVEGVAKTKSDAKAKKRADIAKAKEKVSELRKAKYRGAARGIGIGGIGLLALQMFGKPIYDELVRDGDIPPEEMATPEQLQEEQGAPISDDRSDADADADFYDIMATASMGGDPAMLTPAQLADVGVILADAEANPDDYGEATLNGLRNLAQATSQSMLAADGGGLDQAQLASFKSQGIAPGSVPGMMEPDTPEVVTPAVGPAPGDVGDAAATTLENDQSWIGKGLDAAGAVLDYDQATNLIEGYNLSKPFADWARQRIEENGNERDIPRALAVSIAEGAQALEDRGVTAQDLRTGAGDIPGMIAGFKAGSMAGSSLPLGTYGRPIAGLAGGIGGAMLGQEGVNRLQEGLDPWLREKGINPDLVEGGLQVGGGALAAKGALTAARSALPGVTAGLGALGGGAALSMMPTAAAAATLPDNRVAYGPDKDKEDPGFFANMKSSLGLGGPAPKERVLILEPAQLEMLQSDPATMAEIDAMLEEGDTQGASDLASMVIPELQAQTQGPRVENATEPFMDPALPPGPDMQVTDPLQPMPPTANAAPAPGPAPMPPGIPPQAAGLGLPPGADQFQPGGVGLSGSPQEAAAALAAERQLPTAQVPDPAMAQVPDPAMAQAAPDAMDGDPELAEAIQQEEEDRIDAARKIIDVADLGIGTAPETSLRPEARPVGLGDSEALTGSAGMDTSLRPQMRPDRGLSDPTLASSIAAEEEQRLAGLSTSDGSAPETLHPRSAAEAGVAARRELPGLDTSEKADEVSSRQAEVAFQSADPQSYWDRLNSPAGLQRLATGLRGFGAGIALSKGNGLQALNAGMTGFNLAITEEEKEREAAKAEAAEKELDYQRGLEKEERDYDREVSLVYERIAAKKAAAGDGADDYDTLKAKHGPTMANKIMLKRWLSTSIVNGDAPQDVIDAIMEANKNINPGDTRSYEEIVNSGEDGQALISGALNQLVLKLDSKGLDEFAMMLGLGGAIDG